MCDYSIVIPVYNSGEWIKELVATIVSVMEMHQYDFEIILVNDCSPKRNTWEKLEEVSNSFASVHAIDLLYNVGQIKALMCGMEKANGKYIITMDDDFQHNPNFIPLLINKISDQQCDCVIAQYDKKNDNGLRKIGSIFVNELYSKIYNKPKNITSNSFRIMTREIAMAICSYRTNHPQFGPILFSISHNVETITVHHEKRKYGKSGYSFNKMIDETLNIIVSSSSIPYKLLFISSFVINFIALFYIFLVIVLKKVSYFSIIITFLLLISAIICLGISLIGLYVVRTMEELIGPQKYIIRRMI